MNKTDKVFGRGNLYEMEEGRTKPESILVLLNFGMSELRRPDTSYETGHHTAQEMRRSLPEARKAYRYLLSHPDVFPETDRVKFRDELATITRDFAKIDERPATRLSKVFTLVLDQAARLQGNLAKNTLAGSPRKAAKRPVPPIRSRPA